MKVSCEIHKVKKHGNKIEEDHICKVGNHSQGDPKAPISLDTTTPPFPGFPHFTFDPYLIMQCINQNGIKYHFWVFVITRRGIEPGSPRQLVNT